MRRLSFTSSRARRLLSEGLSSAAVTAFAYVSAGGSGFDLVGVKKCAEAECVLLGKMLNSLRFFFLYSSSLSIRSTIMGFQAASCSNSFSFLLLLHTKGGCAWGVVVLKCEGPLRSGPCVEWRRGLCNVSSQSRPLSRAMRPKWPLFG